MFSPYQVDVLSSAIVLANMSFDALFRTLKAGAKFRPSSLPPTATTSTTNHSTTSGGGNHDKKSSISGHRGLDFFNAHKKPVAAAPKPESSHPHGSGVGRGSKKKDHDDHDSNDDDDNSSSDDDNYETGDAITR